MMLFFLAYDSSHIDDVEFVVLHDIVCHGKNPELPFKDYDSFSLEETDAVECNVNFRFKKTKFQFWLVLWIFLRNLHAHKEQFVKKLKDCVFFFDDFATLVGTYSDLIPLFGRPVPELCMISNEVVDFIYERHREKIIRWNHQLLNPYCLQQYADAVHQKGAA